jgi:uncharacterized protein (DUF2249 family)
MISGDVTVGRLLDEHPELLDVLAEAHPQFARLRNRVLRSVMAPRVTVAQAARIAGMEPETLLARLRAAAGTPAPAAPEAAPPAEPAVAPAPEPRPAVLAALRPVHVDVRPDLREGREPFARIMAAVRDLAGDEVLVLRAPFEPIPLYDVLGRRGFAHWTERHDAADWAVWFYRGAPGGETAEPAATAAGSHCDALVIDVRGLEPPQPMLRVLERLDTLEAGQALVVLHERRPVFLYPLLDERGFVHETQDVDPGLVRIVIRTARGGAPEA